MSDFVYNISVLYNATIFGYQLLKNDRSFKKMFYVEFCDWE